VTIFGIQPDRIVRVGSTWSTSALQTAMKRAIERHNMTRFTPVGHARDLAVTTLRLVIEALADGNTALAAAVLEQVQPDSPDNNNTTTTATVTGCIGVALGLLDDWLTGSDPHAPSGLGQQVKLPAGHWPASAPQPTSWSSPATDQEHLTTRDNALAESAIGLYKIELIKPAGPRRTAEQVELAPLHCVDWFSHTIWREWETAWPLRRSCPDGGYDLAYQLLGVVPDDHHDQQGDRGVEPVPAAGAEDDVRPGLDNRGGTGPGAGLPVSDRAWHRPHAAGCPARPSGDMPVALR